VRIAPWASKRERFARGAGALPCRIEAKHAVRGLRDAERAITLPESSRTGAAIHAYGGRAAGSARADAIASGPAARTARPGEDRLEQRQKTLVGNESPQ
jgi:hypothetical protein